MEKQLKTLQTHLRQAFGTRSRLERQMDRLDVAGLPLENETTIETVSCLSRETDPRRKSAEKDKRRDHKRVSRADPEAERPRPPEKSRQVV